MKWVVKFGGSQYANPRLAQAMRHAARLQPQPLIVPGGGAFADQVRRAQKRWGFADATAHKMALLAMRQYGLLLAALGGLPIIHDEVDGSAKFIGGVWLPNENRRYGNADWHHTSDSVAAWLANQMAADYLVLVKPVGGRAASIETLVDKRFMEIIRRARDLRVTVFDMDDWLGFTNTRELSAYAEIGHSN